MPKESEGGGSTSRSRPRWMSKMGSAWFHFTGLPPRREHPRQLTGSTCSLDQWSSQSPDWRHKDRAERLRIR